MPIAIALLLRSVLQFVITVAVYKSTEIFLETALPVVARAYARLFDISEKEATEWWGWRFIEVTASLGVTAAALRAHAPTKVVEFLGLTSKGFRLPMLSKETTAAIEAKAGKLATGKVSGTSSFWQALGGVDKWIVRIFLLTQSVEVFAYRGNFFTNIASFFGLKKPLEALLTPPKKALFTEEEIKNMLNGLQKEYGKGIPDNELQTTLVLDEQYTRGLIGVAEQLVWQDQKIPTQANVLKKIREEILPTKTGEPPTGTKTAAAPSPSAIISNVKVFTGVLSQGTLGAPLTFTARPDDIIESLEELKDAAQNNLTAFAATIPGRLVYELKIVSSVVSRDGFKQTGAEIQIPNGFKRDGTQRFKTVRNKFATLDIFVLTDRKIRTKISSIILGPTDSGKLTPTHGEIKIVEKTIQNDTFTSRIEDITAIQTAQPLTVSAPTIQTAAAAVTPQTIQSTPPSAPPSTEVLTLPQKAPVSPEGGVNAFRANERTIRGLKVSSIRQEMIQGQLIFIITAEDGIETRTGRPLDEVAPLRQSIIAPPPESPQSGVDCGANTLFEWYGSKGQPLPTVADRSKLYQELKLGQAVFYTGTAEQNIRLLSKLKEQGGCKI